ncbi:hypothetical protein TRAPUB_8515 [Trametes pubescens]|uniref:Fungal N-terminal domain-containing protein n=1 Tax=Trametes pubescens TaxID=154538 RepID=A0A1M2W4Z9_TRAPU|nr:hypothetical protein TRAPUB_8515 [Trametes pubescens]
MELLETSIKALEIAKLVTAQIPVPGLSTAVECALSIAKKAKDIKDTRDDCRALAERVATLVVAVYQQLKHGSSDTEVKEHVETFLQNLQAIENLMDRRLRPRKRDRLLFALKRGKIADEVKTLTTKLEDCFRSFMIQTALAINQDMNTLRSGNVRMLQYIDDSARVGEVVLGDTRVIRTGLSDLAQRVRGSATFDGNHSRTEVYHIGSDEVVFHHRHGGRIKWARDPIAPEKADNLQISVLSQVQARTLWCNIGYLSSWAPLESTGTSS